MFGLFNGVFPMKGIPDVEYIDSELEALMERFFVHSRNDLRVMLASLSAQDYVELARLGHTAKGTGAGYGFTGMSHIGEKLESAARSHDFEACQEWIEEMAYYLDKVKIEYR